ncbi:MULTISPECIES: cytochrome c oxidase accessory protein CcoG [Myroides]|uniref:Cytochrome c oxidase accessory protein CcoG n=1 Tax=Myroides albus TaxID=2562892 RepID=A0A6I3LFA4_9FLAO|nr:MULTISPECIES: cytochrome c oxidase accessory protein CcoG [Myroides]MTG98149.1 cytochrome c oxidase accessory protein CcoG [Myroides albus]MVX35421.1 cytochrome c oxidase accessory protein CcoG [Myroides sp. LoEW2-1]UVD78635.1 cytochrome c oxidase accessory protein CcoG [Myroides albus]
MATMKDESFRDSIGTIDKDGKRAWIFPKKPSGPFYDKRKIVSYLLIAFLFAAPFIKVNGNQFLLFNVIDRKFNIFGFPFWPQDFYLVVISLVIGVVFVTLFTVSFGRIFCGWICPQTIFMEMVFRRIEYWIDGDRGAQARLRKQNWNGEKIRKRLLKWFIFFIISFIIANIFLSYIIGSDVVIQMMKDGPALHLGKFVGLLIFTGAFYFIFAWFREQVCVIACPYGRLQGVLLDNKSIIVAYDYVRGEGTNGRAKFKKDIDREAQGFGDCIDCKQCVNVCPTGIDIRNGTQLECVNCTACIDECDHMMESVGLPKGLIRYASESEISENKKTKFTARQKGYTAVLFILISVLVGLLFLRTDIEATILRVAGQTYQHQGDQVTNLYTYKVVNKTMKDFDNITFKVVDPESGSVQLISKDIISVKKEGYAEGSLFVRIPELVLESHRTKIKIEVYDGDKLIHTTSTNFLGPRIME